MRRFPRTAANFVPGLIRGTRYATAHPIIPIADVPIDGPPSIALGYERLSLAFHPLALPYALRTREILVICWLRPEARRVSCLRNQVFHELIPRWLHGFREEMFDKGAEKTGR